MYMQSTLLLNSPLHFSPPTLWHPFHFQPWLGIMALETPLQLRCAEGTGGIQSGDWEAREEQASSVILGGPVASENSLCLQPGPLWSRVLTPHCISQRRMCLDVQICPGLLPPRLRSFCAAYHLTLRLGSSSALNWQAQLPKLVVTSGSLHPCSLLHGTPA